VRAGKIVRHILVPAVMPVAFYAVALTPVEVLGCRTRGLIAVLIALVSGLTAIGAAIIATKGRLQGDADSQWWIAGSLILTIPVVALIVMA
jgi:hypothetical protein